MLIIPTELGVGRGYVWKKEDGSRKTKDTESGEYSAGLKDPKQSYYMSIRDAVAQEAREGWRGGGSHRSREGSCFILVTKDT